MGKVKWDINGKGVEPGSGGGNNYSGPDLPKGSYIAKVKRMTLGTIKAKGDNHGKPRISVLLEVCGPDRAEQYFGAPIWDGLNVIKSSVPFVNAFLHGLTDGSDSAKRAVESAFWDSGPNVKSETNKQGEKVVHIKSIGKYKIGSPNGELLVQITTRASKDLQGNYRPEISGYIPIKGSTNASSDDDDEEYGEDDDDDDETTPEDDEDDDEEYGEDDDAEDDDSSDEDEDEPVAAGKKPRPF